MLPTGSRIEYFQRGIINKRWHFRLIAPNNEIIASSQSKGYTSRAMMLKTLETYFMGWELHNHDRDRRRG